MTNCLRSTTSAFLGASHSPAAAENDIIWPNASLATRKPLWTSKTGFGPESLTGTANDPLFAAIDQPRSTPLYDALKEALINVKEFQRQHPDTAIRLLVLTDGEDNSSSPESPRELQALISEWQHIGAGRGLQALLVVLKTEDVPMTSLQDAASKLHFAYREAHTPILLPFDIGSVIRSAMSALLSLTA